jgi:ligand-binding SRPBCC domain-containing protein
MLYHLERSLFIPRPREEVFSFFADAGNLERITPGFLFFHILTPRPIVMKVPFHWQTLIEAFDPVSSFTDIQITGPYRRWHHRHDFIDASGGTTMRDRVEYELPLGPMGTIARSLFVRRALDRIFDHRNATITEIFGK